MLIPVYWATMYVPEKNKYNKIKFFKIKNQKSFFLENEITARKVRAKKGLFVFLAPISVFH